MKQAEEMEMQLWEYIDGACTIAESERIAALITNNELWQRQYNELLALNNNIANSMEQEQPSMRFAKNVMDAVATTKIAPATGKYLNLGIIRGIAAFFLVTLTILTCYVVATANWSAGNIGFSFSRLHIEQYFSGTTFNFIVAANIIVALLLVDGFIRRQKITNQPSA